MNADEAIEKAKQAVKRWYPEADATSVLLEAIEPEPVSDPGLPPTWSVTLSFFVPRSGPVPLSEIMRSAGVANALKLYKVFKVKAGTGEVVSMKMHDPSPQAA